MRDTLFDLGENEPEEVPEEEKTKRYAELTEMQEKLFRQEMSKIPAWLRKLGYPDGLAAGDLGSSGGIFAHDVNGSVVFPRNLGRGLVPVHKNTAKLRWLTDNYPLVVFESATIGSSGIDREAVRDMSLDPSRGKFLKISGRVVKNTYPVWFPSWERSPDDPESAWIIFIVSLTKPDSLSPWRYRDNTVKQWKQTWNNRSVRPDDKYNYATPRCDEYIARLPPYEQLGSGARKLYGDGNKYSRARVVPLVMALDEEGADTREGYEAILGLWGNGAPSFYRRATNDLREYAEKALIAHVTKKADVTREQRKEALRLTRREIRKLRWMTINRSTLFPTLFD